jgi:hypothetical protein
MVSKREMTPAITALVRAAVAEMDAGRGVREPPRYHKWGFRLEWVVVGTDLWDRYCPGLHAPWRYRGQGNEPWIDDLNRVWDVLDEVAKKHDVVFATRFDPYGSGPIPADEVRIERPVEPFERKGSPRCSCAQKPKRSRRDGGLPMEKIEELASRKGVRRVAVENFLMTISRDGPIDAHYANLQMDARLYNWNAATVAAIRAGISALYR